MRRVICARLVTGRGPSRAPPVQQVDYMCTQALLFQHVGLSSYQQLKILYAYRTRVSSE